MKKILIVLISVLLLLTTTGCSAEANPEDTLTKAMESIKANEDLTSTFQYFSEESVEQIKSDLAEQTSDEDMKYFDKALEWYAIINPALMKNLSYKILSSEFSDDKTTAIVTMEVSNMDFAPVFEAFVPEVFAYVMTLYMSEDAPDFENMTVEEQEELSMQLVADMLDIFVEVTEEIEEVEIITNTVEVEMTKAEDGSWYISDEEFYLYLMSNIQEASEEVSEGLLEGFLE